MVNACLMGVFISQLLFHMRAIDLKKLSNSVVSDRSQTKIAATDRKHRHLYTNVVNSMTEMKCNNREVEIASIIKYCGL